MPTRLDQRQADFDSQLDAFLARRRGFADSVDDAVAGIIEDIRRRGDDALIELTRKYDRFEATTGNIRLGRAEINQMAEEVPAGQRAALGRAAERIRAYHARQVPEDVQWTDHVGAKLGWRWTAIPMAGLYAPGGLASYPSSVLMNAIPARLAGVEEISLAAPSPGGEINPLLMLAAELSGIGCVLRIGGAQAIAAMALGTESISKVDKIAGPGNAYVTAAKRQLFGSVGIDLIAGPSEVVVVSDDTGNPAWIAADLLAQAEHDEDAQSILVTTCSNIAGMTAAEVERQLPLLPRSAIAAHSWNTHGCIILVEDEREAAAVADRIAAEHVQICVQNPAELAGSIRNAGAIFLGHWTPEVIGDYVGGPSHVLPTYGAARFSSGLSVLDFMKRTSLIGLNRRSFAAIGHDAETLAFAEGLAGHGEAIRCRFAGMPEEEK